MAANPSRLLLSMKTELLSAQAVLVLSLLLEGLSSLVLSVYSLLFVVDVDSKIAGGAFLVIHVSHDDSPQGV